MKLMRRLRRSAGSVVRGARRFIETRLHPGRHRAVSDRIRAMKNVRNILVICHGNICRSPYLEAVLRASLPDAAVSSAGFVGAGRGVPPNSSEVAGRTGLDLSGHKSRLITGDILDGADLLIVMGEDQARALRLGFGVPPELIVVAGDLDPESNHGRAILDPWGQPVAAFEASFHRLDRIAAQFVSLINDQR
jgi:protein-tyrosine phosphatase